jgi:glucose/arabinose dehydrogenase
MNCLARPTLALLLFLPLAPEAAPWLPSPEAGWQVSLFAKVRDARSLAVDHKGRIFVGTRRDDKVWMLEDTDADGIADKTRLIASDLNMPNGIAVSASHLYVVSQTRIDRFPLDNLSAREVWLEGLPQESHHGWRYAGIGPDQALYISIGAPCNVCLKAQDRFALILRVDPITREKRVVARGVRNSVGFAWDPADNTLWFTDNGRDWMGDDIPPDELNHLTGQSPEHFGFPYVFGRSVPDPAFAEQRPKGLVTQPPVWEFTAHAAPLGLTFMPSGPSKPNNYSLLVALHGSWNRSTLVGYKVVELTLEDGRVTAQRDFLSGFLDHGVVRGRPVDLVLHPHLGILVSDDFAGRIYRVYRAPSPVSDDKP